jgi:hypothetical protein
MFHKSDPYKESFRAKVRLSEKFNGSRHTFKDIDNELNMVFNLYLSVEWKINKMVKSKTCVIKAKVEGVQRG